MFTDWSLPMYVRILLLCNLKRLCLNPVHGNLCCINCKDDAVLTVGEAAVQVLM